MAMKILSVSIPCYNSASYMETCIKSLLPGGDDIEILIVDDGSTKDNTFEIAQRYESEYPGIVRAIHQENAGHGGAVNTGIKEANGVFFKNIDSDDWADTDVLLKIIGILKELESNGTKVDLFLANYVFDREDSDKKTVMRFKGAFPKGRPFTWNEVGHMGQSQFIMMHTIIYRRDVLIASRTELPRHAYYVDNIYAFQPLPFTKTIYYLDEALYHYRIGRADQSVNVQVQLKNIDQQIMVDKLITDIYVNRPEDLSARLEKYLIAFVKLMYCATSAILLVGGTPEHLAKKEELWNYLKNVDPVAYKKVRRSFMGGWMNIPTALGRKISVAGYKISQKIFAFN